MALRRENRDLRRSNEILKAASVFFARELDQPVRSERVHRSASRAFRVDRSVASWRSQIAPTARAEVHRPAGERRATRRCWWSPSWSASVRGSGRRCRQRQSGGCDPHGGRCHVHERLAPTLGRRPPEEAIHVTGSEGASSAAGDQERVASPMAQGLQTRGGLELNLGDRLAPVGAARSNPRPEEPSDAGRRQATAYVGFRERAEGLVWRARARPMKSRPNSDGVPDPSK